MVVAVLLWLLVLLVGSFVVALLSSAKLRRNFFIWLSYATITGWYYFRVFQKKYMSDDIEKDGEAASMSPPPSANDKPVKTSQPCAAKILRHPNFGNLEPRDDIEKRQQGCQGESGRVFESDRFLNCSNAADEGAKCHENEACFTENVTESNGCITALSKGATRRTYIGRKKPASWAD
ncbi:hypothetical protein CCR75_006810 [Bremia lactucae]|uniref:Uncharacterized protein n=1 Tax=Bremia lactucae TaxID=4779 RepID=A0A976ICA4_BRELC|nr:hypothetical protein CCR75_006810 [Bremia lactucae]